MRTNTLRVLHVIPSLSLVHGGPSIALPLMAKALVKQGVEIDIATTDDDGHGKRKVVSLGSPVPMDEKGGKQALSTSCPAIRVFYFRKQTEFYKYSRPLARWLGQHIREYDLVHIHALFSYSSIAAGRAAFVQGVPFIIRPLGVLNRWGIENRRPLLKMLSLRFFEGPLLRRAVAMHYTSTQEQQEAEEAGAVATGFVVPLDVQPERYEALPAGDVFINRFPAAKGKRVILFLSRIDRKKGLELLIEAFAMVRPEHGDSVLVIAGSGDQAYTAELERKAEALGVAGSMVWTGFLEGADKLSAFAAATCYVLPSHSENFGIAFAEALAAGVPSIACDGVAIASQAAASNAALLAESNRGSIADAITRLFKDDGLRKRLGENARTFVQANYSSEAIGTALKREYERVLSEPRSRRRESAHSFA